MYVPPIYRTDDPARAQFVVRGYPLAVLLTNGRQLPYATHVPVVFETAQPEPGGLEGAHLLGHMNRANPHWAALADGTTAKLIFAGPHSYITPTVYDADVAAPTWDFVAVHLHGTVHPIAELDDTLQVVRRTVDDFESLFGDNWDPGPSLAYFRDIVPAVGAFRFRVTTVDGMFKLSQEKELEVRDRIIKHLDGARSGSARDLAMIMRMFGTGRDVDA